MRAIRVLYLLCGLFALTLLGAGWVSAATPQKPTFAGFRGLNIEQANTDRGQNPSRNFPGTLGFRLSPAWRVEGEGARFTHEHKRGDTRETRLGLVNLYYDADIGSDRVQPFIGIGAGLMERRDLSDDHRALDLAVHAGGGVRLMLNRNLSLSGDYRFINTLPLYHRGAAYGDESERHHQLRFGLTYDIPPTRIIDPAFAR